MKIIFQNQIGVKSSRRLDHPSTGVLIDFSDAPTKKVRSTGIEVDNPANNLVPDRRCRKGPAENMEEILKEELRSSERQGKDPREDNGRKNVSFAQFLINSENLRVYSAKSEIYEEDLS